MFKFATLGELLHRWGLINKWVAHTLPVQVHNTLPSLMDMD